MLHCLFTIDVMCLTLTSHYVPKGKTGKFAYHILLSEVGDIMYLQSKRKRTRERTNFGDDKGLRIPCFLQFSRPKENIELLKKLLPQCKQP